MQKTRIFVNEFHVKPKGVYGLANERESSDSRFQDMAEAIKLKLHFTALFSREDRVDTRPVMLNLFQHLLSHTLIYIQNYPSNFSEAVSTDWLMEESLQTLASKT